MADALHNFSYSTVATAPSPATTGTSLVVAAGDGAKFAVGNAVCWPANVQPSTTNAEIVRVTAISTDTLTITRAQEGTTAQSIAVGYQIDQGVTAALLAQYVPVSDAATSVTGPDAYGAPAVVGSGTTFARADHDHGLPAAPSPSLSVVTGDAYGVTIPTTLTTVMTTPSLAVGTWLLFVDCSYLLGQASPAMANAASRFALGTATATFTGSYNSGGVTAGVATTGTDQFGLSETLTVIAVVTVAGTLLVNASGANLGTSPSAAFRLTGVKIA